MGTSQEISSRPLKMTSLVTITRVLRFIFNICAYWCFVVPEIEGLSIKRLSGKSNGTQSLLAWDTKRKAPRQDQSLSPQPNQEEVAQRSNNAEEGFAIKGYHWSEQKMKQYGGTCPYGISDPYERPDAAAERKKKEGGTAPKSLGSFVKK